MSLYKDKCIQWKIFERKTINQVLSNQMHMRTLLFTHLHRCLLFSEIVLKLDPNCTPKVYFYINPTLLLLLLCAPTWIGAVCILAKHAVEWNFWMKIQNFGIFFRSKHERMANISKFVWRCIYCSPRWVQRSFTKSNWQRSVFFRQVETLFFLPEHRRAFLYWNARVN